MEWLLSQLSDSQAAYVRLAVLEGYSFVDIARAELPGESTEDVERRANTIGRSVKRGLQRLKTFIQTRCPELCPATDG